MIVELYWTIALAWGAFMGGWAYGQGQSVAIMHGFLHCTLAWFMIPFCIFRYLKWGEIPYVKSENANVRK